MIPAPVEHPVHPPDFSREALDWAIYTHGNAGQHRDLILDCPDAIQRAVELPRDEL
jgi:hypothetical protein